MTKLDIFSLREAYLKRKLTPRQLVAELFDRAGQIDQPAIWIHRLSAEELEPYLRSLDAVDPDALPLYGVPFAIKDNIDLSGVPTTAACEAYSYVPEVSAPVVKKLIRAGALPLGKTNLDQFATGLVGVRSPYGAPRNPYAPDRVPGGSSSGSAVALAEELASFSLGTDTAGSGRVPAAFNRLWGVKPSRGRLSAAGVVPACRTLDCVSIFTLNGEDARTVLRVAEGYDPADAYSQPTRDLPLPANRKLGIPRMEQLMFFGDAGYSSAWQETLGQLESAGYELMEIDFEPFLRAARLLYEGPWVAERTTALKDFLESNAEDFYPATRSILSGGLKATACEAFAASYELAELKRASEAVWEGIAAVVTPTAGGFPTLAELEADPIGPNSQLGYYTNFMNLLDLCAVATPAADGAGGLPFGITWIAPRDTDRALIDLTAAFAGRGDQSNSARAPSGAAADRLSLLLFGAHMRGLPLNGQVLGLGATFVGEVHTAPAYKMVYLPEPDPHRPGVLRVAEGGRSIAAEEWSFPKCALGEFLAGIRHPLGLAEIELTDGRFVHGFLCESATAETAEDLSRFGGWREFLG
ncbi:MAG: allophanate hydrolase [Opitutales bacterium]